MGGLPGAGGGGPSVQEVGWGDVSMHLGVLVIGSDLSFLKYDNVGVKWLLRVWTNEVNNSAAGVGCSSCAWVSSQVKRDMGDVRTPLETRNYYLPFLPINGT